MKHLEQDFVEPIKMLFFVRLLFVIIRTTKLLGDPKK